MKSILPFIIIVCSFFNFGWAQTVGSSAPDFSLSYVSGGTFHLSEQKGKVVFLFIFGNQCPHCRSNGPNTESGIYEVYKNNPNFVAVGIDVWDGNASLVEDFQDRTGISYPLCLNGSAIEELYNTTYDRIIVIDQEGIIRFKDNAQATSSVVAKASEVIEQYLNESSDDDMSMDDDMVLSTDTTPEFQLYPNPIIESRLSISSPELLTQNGYMAIYDLSGKVVLNQNLQSNMRGTYQIDNLHNLKGTYIAKVRLGSKTYNRRIFISK